MRSAALIAVVCAISVGSNPLFVRAQRKLIKKTVAYREVDGHRILADVYRPTGKQLRPVIIWIHGGALIMGHRGGVHPRVRMIAEQQGYGLVSIDYRLAPETKLPGIISDIEAAFQWLAQIGSRQFHLDPSRVVVTGGSAGGYLTLVTGYRAKPRPKALVALYGYGDLVGDWYSTPSPHPRHNRRKIARREAVMQTDGTVISDARRRKGNGGWIYLHYRQQGIWPQEVSGFKRDTIAKQIRPYEPLRNVSKQFSPTLLIHGTKDTDVPFEQSRLMAAEFKRHGVDHQLLPIANGEHGFGGGSPAEIDQAYEVMRTFIIKHLEDK